MSKKAWRYSAIEGARGASALSVTVFLTTLIVAAIFVRSDLSGWLIWSVKLSLGALALGFVLITPYARWELWRNNQVKPK